MLLSLIIVQFFQQVFAGLEFDTGAGGDHAIFTRAGIASETFGLLPGAEGTEALQNDRVTVLQGLGDDAKFGAAGLIMAILGGSVLPPVQASIIDCGTLLGMPAVNLSFILPFICFVVIVIYGHRSYCREKMRK